MAEIGPVFVDSKTIAVAGTAEALTTRDIHCSSVHIRPIPGNTTPVFIVDTATESQKYVLPDTGVTVPINNPALIIIDADTNGEGVDWMAV